jgi:magnesium transporter
MGLYIGNIIHKTLEKCNTHGIIWHMISKYTYKGLTWVDLESPTDEELAHVVEEYSIPSMVAEEMTTESLRSKAELHPDFIYLILRFPHITHTNARDTEQEIDFVVGNNFIITTHYEFIDSLHEFSKTFEVDMILDRGVDADHAGFLFFHLIKTLYTHSRYQLGTIDSRLKNVEKKIFEGTEGSVVVMISNINRILLDFHQALRFHREILNSFELSAKKFFGEDFGYYTANIMSEYNKTQAVLDSHKEVLHDLRDTNDSLLANKTNETIRRLTIITFLMSPIMILAAIFTIPTGFLIFTTPLKFSVLLAIMLLISLTIFIYFKIRKWL